MQMIYNITIELTMSDEDFPPPWIREQVSRLQQIQQNLQAIMMKKHQIEQETSEIERVIEEIKKVAWKDNKVYKNYNTLWIKSNRENILKGT